MLRIIQNLSIRKKISGFIIPSTISFGLLMTVLALFLLHDFRTAIFADFNTLLDTIQTSTAEISININEQVQQIEQEADQKFKTTAALLVSIVAAVILFATAGALLISAAIGKPVKNIAGSLENISSGEADLTQRLPVKSQDETGKVSHFFNVFLEKLQEIMAHLQASGLKLNKAAASTHKHLKVIWEKAETSKELSETVFRSAGYLSKDMKEISSILEQSTENIHVISSSVDELSTTITDISETSNKANTNTEKAKEKMDTLEKDVQELDRVSQDISNVTETITEISEQVNMLALNATIEAARAGEAGKGFAVVANEIKELAHQTASAATEIQQRISEVQQVTSSTVSGIDEAAEIVSNNTEVVAAIANAVEEQSATVNEIATSLTGASDNLDYSNEKISKASHYADDMATMATSVTEAVVDVDEAVTTLMDTSKDLKELAVQSVRTTRQFKT